VDAVRGNPTALVYRLVCLPLAVERFTDVLNAIVIPFVEAIVRPASPFIIHTPLGIESEAS
jgi:hypothetical protein